MRRIKKFLNRLANALTDEKIRQFHLDNAGNLIPLTLAVVFTVFLVTASMGLPEARFFTYLLAGIGIGYSLAALRRMGCHPTGWPTLLVLIFFWAKAILGMIYFVLLLIGLELIVIGTNHVSDNSMIGLLASVSVMQLILGLFLFYGAKHHLLTRRVDPGFLLRWVFRGNVSGIIPRENPEE